MRASYRPANNLFPDPQPSLRLYTARPQPGGADGAFNLRAAGSWRLRRFRQQRLATQTGIALMTIRCPAVVKLSYNAFTNMDLDKI